MSDVEKALEEIMEKEIKVMLKTQLKATKRKQTMLKLWRCGREQWRAFAQHRKERRVMKSRMKRMLKPKPKITRRSGGETIAYLREKNDMAQKWKAEELELQKQRLEVESKQQDESRTQHQETMQMMAQQVRQEQNQIQQFQQMFATMQQQQSQIILKLLEKQN